MGLNNSEAFAFIWRDLHNQFTDKPISLNFKEFVTENTKEKRSDIYTHYCHAYPAKIFPYLPIFFYSIPELCPPSGLILDPFCGSGTTLLESIVHPFFPRNALGVEMNPLGRLITKVKTTKLDTEILQDSIAKIKKHSRNISTIKPKPIESKKINFWFSKQSILELSRIKQLIEEQATDSEDINDFLWLCYSKIIRKASLADPFIPPPVLLKLEKYKNSPDKYKYLSRYLDQARKGNILNNYLSSLETNFSRIQQLNLRINHDKKARVIWHDAREIKRGTLCSRGRLFSNGGDAALLEDNSVDLVLTSPPYLSAQKYIRTSTLELLWLDLVSEENLGQLDSQIIGTERISFKEFKGYEDTNIKSVDALVKWSSIHSKEKALIVFNYFRALQRVINEIYRVLKKDSYSIIVIGNNQVLGRKVETYSMIADIAVSHGFKLELVLSDTIRGRGMITRRHGTGGLIQKEYAVVLKKC
jgi:DNA modification methylase